MELSTSLNILNEPKAEYNYFRGRHNLNAIQMCHDAGFRVIDWNAGDYCSMKQIQAYGDSDLTSEDWKENMTAMREKADSLGMRFNQCHSMMFNYFEENEHTQFLHQMSDRVLEGCSILGVPRIVYHPVVPPGLRELQDVNKCRQANVEYIRREAEKAGRYGIEIAVENMFLTHRKDGSLFWRYCSTPEELIDLVDAIDMENVCVCLDVGHAHLMSEDFAETIAKYGKRLRALHIADNDKNSDQHLLPYHGTIAWETVMKALSDNDYVGEFTLETHNAAIRMPSELRFEMLKECYRVSKWLVERYDHYNKLKTDVKK